MSYIPKQDDIDNPCGVCGIVFDGKTSMSECSKCLSWYHDQCVESVNDVEEDEAWFCDACVLSKAIEEADRKKTNRRKSMQIEKPTNVKNATSGTLNKSSEDMDKGEEIDKLKKALEENRCQLAKAMRENYRLSKEHGKLKGNSSKASSNKQYHNYQVSKGKQTNIDTTSEEPDDSSSEDDYCSAAVSNQAIAKKSSRRKDARFSKRDNYLN